MKEELEKDVERLRLELNALALDPEFAAQLMEFAVGEVPDSFLPSPAFQRRSPCDSRSNHLFRILENYVRT